MDKINKGPLNINLHIHTTHSDGKLSPEQVIEKAVEQNMEIIGFSDHFLTKKLPENRQVLFFDWYFNTIYDLKKRYNKPKILIGLEIDCGRGTGEPPDNWNCDELNKLDYVLLEYINNPGWNGRDLHEVISSISEKIKIPIGLAHPHLMKDFHLGSKEKCNKFCKFLKEHNIFIELNEGENGANSFSGKYYFEFFSHDLIESFKEYEVEFSIGTDSHSSYKLDKIKKAQAFIENNNLIIIHGKGFSNGYQCQIQRYRKSI